MSNRRDFTKKDPVFTGTTGLTPPTGTQGQRPGSPTLGVLRYNTDLNLPEFYTSTGWAPVAPPPSVDSISGTINEDTDSTITITGSGFDTAAVVSILGNAVSGVERTLSTTFINSGELTAATNASSVNFVGNVSFDVKVTNTTGLSSTLATAGTVDRDPVWSTGAGSRGSFGDRDGSITVTHVATDPDGTGVTYSLASGSIPPGTTLDTGTGTISGDPTDVGGSTTSTYTLRATSNGYSQDRTFSITITPTADGSSAARAGVHAQQLIDSGVNITSASQYYVNPTSGTAFQQYLAGDLSDLCSIPGGVSSWVTSHTGLNIISRSITGSQDTMLISYNNFLDTINQSMSRNTSTITPYFYWAVVSGGTLWGITRTRFESTSFSEWRDHHTGDYSPAPSQLTARWWAWHSTYTINSATADHVRAIPYRNITSVVPGGNYNTSSYGLHYKRTGSGEHYPWRDASDNCTSNGYFANSQSIPAGSVHYIYVAEN